MDLDLEERDDWRAFDDEEIAGFGKEIGEGEEEDMRGAGGPLLCIGDLLSDIGESDATGGGDHLSEPSSSSSSSSKPLDLTQLFEENYKQLNEALSESGHSWTAQTLKLCAALETADRLIQSANSDAKFLSTKVETLQTIVKRGDSAVKPLKLMKIAENSLKP